MLSLALLGHVLAMLCAAAPPSETVRKLKQLAEPYCHTLNLTHGWAFFAPNPKPSVELSYIVRSSDGTETMFRTADRYGKTDPDWVRFADLFTINTSEQEVSMAQYLAREHQKLEPVQIRFVTTKQKLITVDEYRQGVRPYHDSHLRTTRRPWIDVSRRLRDTRS
ncbi:MAG: hypothetical protein KDA60_08545 [Planctomycetales bacterium]|nr:hypothetical protein [Planctomycetales bacterium]